MPSPCELDMCNATLWIASTVAAFNKALMLNVHIPKPVLFWVPHRGIAHSRRPVAKHKRKLGTST